MTLSRAVDGILINVCIVLSLILYLRSFGFTDSVVYFTQTVLALLCGVVATYLEVQSCSRLISLTVGWKLRPNVSTGYSSVVLLPFALLTRGFLKPDDYNIAMSLFTTIILMSSMIVICSVQVASCNISTKDSRARRKPNQSNSNILTDFILPYPFNLWSPSHLALVFLGLCFLYSCGAGWSYFLVVTFCQIMYLCLLSVSLHEFPASFTIGEAMILTQGITMLVFDTICDILRKVDLFVCRFDSTVSSEAAYITKIIFVSLLLMSIVLYMVPRLRTSSLFYTACLIICLIFTLPLLYYGIQKNVFTWLLNYLFVKEKIYLIAYWAFITLICIVIVIVKNKHSSSQQKVSTKVRKYFHLAAVLIFIPGLIVDPELLLFASGAALAILVLLEFIRFLRIRPLGEILNNAFRIFLDEKDQGSLIVTHIYLLVGCTLPLWLYPYSLNIQYGCMLLWFAGILSVGVGDTAASVIGSMCGRHKWPDGHKSMEGTLAAIMAQSLFCFVISMFGILPEFSHNCIMMLVVIVLTSLLEAFTTQIDNLILPLYAYNCLQALLMA
ncbi:dolichol kinase-like isoform X1 [Tubulanus polymorphus]|uniref:dolichol kinase-like isoform X1 n=1 Tax=Tubulanus polymorphus TaxID=672921 RepID=UPI003DA64E44